MVVKLENTQLLFIKEVLLSERETDVYNATSCVW
jgi:hypothetical protein